MDLLDPELNGMKESLYGTLHLGGIFLTQGLREGFNLWTSWITSVTQELDIGASNEYCCKVEVTPVIFDTVPDCR